MSIIIHKIIFSGYQAVVIAIKTFDVVVTVETFANSFNANYHCSIAQNNNFMGIDFVSPITSVLSHVLCTL